ncbi:MAG: formylglycine-generating enzyme family protein [Kiritimatiellia bacterium]
MNVTAWVQRAAVCLMGLLVFSAAAVDPAISDVVVRQRWPWSRQVDIDYLLSCEPEKRLDITVKVFNGTDTEALSIPLNSLSGDLYGVSQGSRHIVWDPMKTGYTNEVLSQLRVELASVPKPLYMIVDLTAPAGVSNQIEYVYEADLITNKWGSWERNFIQTNGVTIVESVIWTDVTNDIYKTDQLVLRRVSSGTFYKGDSGIDTTTIDKDFYIGVFEVTQRQWEQVAKDPLLAKPSNFYNAAYYATRPVERISYYTIREDPTTTTGQDDPDVDWPSNTTVNADSFIGQLRAKTAIHDFDLPTEAQWECACRAGTTTVFNDGNADAICDIPGDVEGENNGLTNRYLTVLGRYLFNGGKSDGRTNPERTVSTASGTTYVGSFRPNAWGLYDMHGNVLEWCLEKSGSSSIRRMSRGGAWHNKAESCHSVYRITNEPDYRHGVQGFRLVRHLP